MRGPSDKDAIAFFARNFSDAASNKFKCLSSGDNRLDEGVSYDPKPG